MKGKTPSATPPDAPLDPLEWIGATGAETDIMRAMERQQRNRRRKRFAGAMGTVTALLVAFFAWQLTPPAVPPGGDSGSAIVHVPARQTLPDGTVVDLRDGARLNVAFTPVSTGPRRVELASGEAHFQVAKDKDRSFIVAVGSVEVRAVGTAFSVNRSLSQVEVLVTEGTVAVDQPVGPSLVDVPSVSDPGLPSSGSPTFLSAGERTVVNLSEAVAPQVEAVPESGIKEALSWRVPRLEFSGTPLDEALPMINQYSAVKLVFGDESLGAVRVSGVIRADNIDVLLELLAETKGIRSEQRSETEIVLIKAK